MHIDNIKQTVWCYLCLMLAKNQKRIRNSNTGSEDIQSGYWDGIWQRKMYHANNEKQKMTNDRRNRTTKSIEYQNTLRKGNLQVLGNIESRYH